MIPIKKGLLPLIIVYPVYKTRQPLEKYCPKDPFPLYLILVFDIFPLMIKSIETSDSRLLISFTMAILIHFLAINFLSNLDVSIGIDSPLLPEKKIFKIESLPKNYRTVGVKNGQKDFSLPTRPITKKLTMESLRPNSKEIKQNSPIKRETPTKEKLLLLSNQKVFSGNSLKISKDEYLEQNYQKEAILQNKPIAEEALSTLQNSSLNIKFEPPEGVSEDELNTQEKKFFSFTKRSYETYINSIIKEFNSLLARRPYLKRMENIGNHVLSGKMIFDEQGNVISIKFIQTSQNDDLQYLFEKALTNISVLPNPPKDLLKEDNTFAIYYQLGINK